MAGAPLLAEGAPKRRVAILDLVTEGIPTDVRAQFEASIEERLRGAGYAVVTRAATVEVVGKKDLQEGCTFGPCVSAISRALEVDQLLDVRIGAEGQSYSYVLSLIDAGGFPVAQIADTCGVCTVAEALGKVGAAAGTIDGRPVPRYVDAAPVARVSPKRHSRTLPIMLIGAGAISATAGVALVASDGNENAGWAAVGAGGAALLAGLLVLLTGD
jgi:hypothetical protein